MKKILLSTAFILGFVNVNAQWTVPRPLTIVNNTSLEYYYEIRNHSAFYDGTNDGIINGIYGPFNMNTLNSYWNKDIIEASVCIGEVLSAYSTRNYNEPTQNGLPIGTYSVHPNTNVSNLTDYAQYFRTFYLKGYLYGPGISGPGGGLRYPVPSMTGLTPVTGTTYAYNTSSNMLYDTSTLSYQSMFFMAPGTVAGTSFGFSLQFLEISGMEYVLCSQFP